MDIITSIIVLRKEEKNVFGATKYSKYNRRLDLNSMQSIRTCFEVKEKWEKWSGKLAKIQLGFTNHWSQQTNLMSFYDKINVSRGKKCGRSNLSRLQQHIRYGAMWKTVSGDEKDED